MKLTEAKLRALIREVLLQEYVVPMGYSAKAWLKKKEKEGITNKKYAEETPGDKWKVVTKDGELINKSAKNLSYSKATKMLQAIEISKQGR